MVDKETCIDGILERLGPIIADVEEWSLQDADFIALHEMLFVAQEEAESLFD